MMSKDLCRNGFTAFRSSADFIARNTEVLLNTRRPEKKDESNNTDESGSKLEGINNTRTEPFSNAHGDEVEESRKDEPSRATNKEDKVEETLVELSLLAPGHVETVGEVTPDTNPADKDVNNDERKKSTLGINELSGSSILSSSSHDDEEDEIDNKIDSTNDQNGHLVRKVVISDSPAAGDGDKKDGKDDVGKTHEELTKHTAAVGTNTISTVGTPVDNDEEEREDAENDDTSKDENDGMSNTLAIKGEDSNTVDGTNQDEQNKVDNVQRKKTLLIITNFITILINEVDGVGDIKKFRLTVVTSRTVEQNNIPNVRTNIIMRLQIIRCLTLNAERLFLNTLFNAGTAIVLVVCTPLTFSIAINNPPAVTLIISSSSLINDDSTISLMTFFYDREAELADKIEILVSDKMITYDKSTCRSCK